MKSNGIIFLFIAGLCWSTGGIFLKFTSCDALTASGARSFFALIAIIILNRKLPLFRLKNDDGTTDVKNTVLMWQCGVFYSLTMILFVFANRLTTAANAVLLQYTSPIYVVILSPLLLKEKNTRADYLCVAGVLVGMVLFFADGIKSGNMAGNALALGSGVFYSFLPIFMRIGTKDYSRNSFILANLITAVFCLPFFVLSAQKPDLTSWIFLVLLGFVQIGLPCVCYAAGVKKVRALTASLVVMVEPLMNPVWVFLFTGEAPSLLSIIGGVMVLGFIFLRQVLITANPAKLHTKSQLS